MVENDFVERYARIVLQLYRIIGIATRGIALRGAINGRDDVALLRRMREGNEMEIIRKIAVSICTLLRLKAVGTDMK